MIIKVAEGITFAKVLKKVPEDANLEASETRVVETLPTK